MFQAICHCYRLSLPQVLTLELVFGVTDFFQKGARILRFQPTWFISRYENKQTKKPAPQKSEWMHNTESLSFKTKNMY